MKQQNGFGATILNTPHTQKNSTTSQTLEQSRFTNLLKLCRTEQGSYVFPACWKNKVCYSLLYKFQRRVGKQCIKANENTKTYTKPARYQYMNIKVNHLFVFKQYDKSIIPF